MKSFIFVVLAITVVAETKEVCKPYSVFKDYCNSCVCAHDGSSFACTRKFCNKEIWNKDGSLKLAAKASNEICTPNSHFKEYCNTCVCSKDGSSTSCTMMTCDENLWNKDGTPKVVLQSLQSGVVYEPGKAYSTYGGNTCTCNAVGPNSVCTCIFKCHWASL